MNLIHPSAIIEPGAVIGLGSCVGAFSHIKPGARIGQECSLGNGVYVEDDVVIGNHVILGNGVQIGKGTLIEDDVSIKARAIITSAPLSKSSLPLNSYQTTIKAGTRVEYNSTILAGVTLGRNSQVEPGSVVKRTVPANAIVAGNPAGIVGYAASAIPKVGFSLPGLADDKQSPLLLEVGGCALYRLPLITDIRGQLAVTEFGKDLPFQPKRCFWVFDVPNREVRGEHAHKELHQFLICVKGSASVVLDDGKNRMELNLSQPNVGLHIPPRVWGIQYKYSPDAILLVLTSDIYLSEDYIRDYDDFLAFTKQSTTPV